MGKGVRGGRRGRGAGGSLRDLLGGSAHASVESHFDKLQPGQHAVIKGGSGSHDVHIFKRQDTMLSTTGRTKDGKVNIDVHYKRKGTLKKMAVSITPNELKTGTNRRMYGDILKIPKFGSRE